MMNIESNDLNEGASIGYVIGGGLKENLRIRLTSPAQKIQEGAFVVIETDRWSFYGLVVDLQLGSTDPRFADEPQDRLPAGIAGQLYGQTLFTTLEVLPVLMAEGVPDTADEFEKWLDQAQEGEEPEMRVKPVKTIPSHHSPVKLAERGDIDQIFGKEIPKKNFIIGYTREQNHPVRIDLDKFVLRSAGVFGATGTGKSFLTRVLLAGLLHQDKVSMLVLDMHNEYGFDDRDPETGGNVIGLATKFPQQVSVAGLGTGTKIKGNAPTYNLEISMSDILPEDIELLTKELNLTETTPTTLEALVNDFKGNWFKEFKNKRNKAKIENDEGKKVHAPDSVAYWADQAGLSISAAEALHSKLARVFRKPYIVEDPASDGASSVIEALKKGKSVILSFGKHDQDLDYLLVSNILTRKIREAWVKMTDESRKKESNPRQLVIVIEEAHKLLNREMASQTIFNVIAREMRKYNVTLLIVDQRPSQIYDEVMSQLGTRISGWLGDDDDIRAVLSGIAGRETLRGMLAHLQEKEEVLLLGWGVPMPLPVKSRFYGPDFYKELLGSEDAGKSTEENLRELGF